MAEYMPHDAVVVGRLKRSLLSLRELSLVGDTLSRPLVHQRYGLFEAAPCDPNLLGFSSDLAEKAEEIDCCVVFCPLQHGAKLSVRSGVREVMANELAAFLVQDVGGGGNHEKAGAFLSFVKLAELRLGMTVRDFLLSRLKAYADYYDLVYSQTHALPVGTMPVYEKKRLLAGYAPSVSAFPDGAAMCVRTLEGDLNLFATPDIYLMVGVEGEVYPIRRKNFLRSYEPLDTPYALQTEYDPMVIDRISGERVSLLPLTRCCRARAGSRVHAEELRRPTKVFTAWDEMRYMYGAAGDFIAVRVDDPTDVYIVRRDIFQRTYEKIDAASGRAQ